MECNDRGKRPLSIYPAATDTSHAPVIFLLSGDEDGEKAWKSAQELAKRPFSLTVVGIDDWNRDLSPWAAKSVFRGGEEFGGGADELLGELEGEIVPSVMKGLRADAPCILAGYSLAGLCAVYALYRTRVFSGVISDRALCGSLALWTIREPMILRASPTGSTFRWGTKKAIRRTQP